MKKIFSYKKIYNVFDLWRKVQIKVDFINKQMLTENQSEAKNLLDKYQLIFSKVIKNEKKWVFDQNVFIALIKYLMDSNTFFNARLNDNQIDELLLLAYVYEWVVLDKPKDISLLGDRSEVLIKFKKASEKSQSYYNTIFEGININEVSDLPNIKKRIEEATKFTYEEILNFIEKDHTFYQKSINNSFVETDYNNKDECLKKWNQLFLITKNHINYVYSITDSDLNIIYISIETNNEKIGFVKFKMFNTYTKEENGLLASGVSKELLQITLLNEEYNKQIYDILANALIVANRVIKHIFLVDLQMQNDELTQNKSNNNQQKKIVTFVKKPSENQNQGDLNKDKIINKALGY